MTEPTTPRRIGSRRYRQCSKLYRLPDGRVVPVDATAAKGAPAIDFTLESGLIVVAREFRADEHEHTWTCGCGWRNGVNLAVCAQCQRHPGANDGIYDNLCVQDEDCIHAQRIATLEADRQQLQQQVQSLTTKVEEDTPR